MKTDSSARVPKLPFFDMITKSVSEIKRDYSKVIKEIEKENEPAFVLNHNKPEAVLMSYEYYKTVLVDTRTMIETVMKEIELLEDEALYAKAASRLSNDNKIWMTSEQVLGTKEENEDNPYIGMSDEELFD